MEKSQFKPGDRVICVNVDSQAVLRQGAAYTVSGVGRRYVTLVGVPSPNAGGWFYHRFILVPDDAADDNLPLPIGTEVIVRSTPGISHDLCTGTRCTVSAYQGQQTDSNLHRYEIQDIHDGKRAQVWETQISVVDEDCLVGRVVRVGEGCTPRKVLKRW